MMEEITEHKHQWSVRAVGVVESPENVEHIFVLWECDKCAKTDWNYGETF